MSGFKLYEISQLLQESIDAADEFIDHETGVIPDDWAKFLDDVQMERDEKCLSVAKYCILLDAESSAIKNEEKKLSSRRRLLNNKYDRIKKYLSTVVKEGEKISDQCVQISWRKSTSTIIDAPDKIPDEYCKIERMPILKDIASAIQSGVELSGIAHIETHQNIQIK